jgi:hypothetical protein
MATSTLLADFCGEFIVVIPNHLNSLIASIKALWIANHSNSLIASIKALSIGFSPIQWPAPSAIISFDLGSNLCRR